MGRLAGRQVDNRCWIVGAVQAVAHESPPCERFQLLTSTDDDDVLLERLRAGGVTNIGLVYNQHHGHEHMDRFPELLAKMKPYLVALNLNGMSRHGDQIMPKV